MASINHSKSSSYDNAHRKSKKRIDFYPSSASVEALNRQVGLGSLSDRINRALESQLPVCADIGMQFEAMAGQGSLTLELACLGGSHG